MPYDPAQPTGGALTREQMIQSGAPQPQVDAWVSQQRQKMLDAGAPIDQVNAYWGITEPNTKPVGDALQAETEPYEHTAENPLEAAVAGWQHSVTGIVQTQGKPTVVPNPNGSVLDAVAETGGQLVGDLPAAALGALGGAGIGAAATPEALGGGAIPGAVLGSAVFPEAMREALLKSYNTTGPYDWRNTVKDAMDIGWSSMKAGAAALVGGKAGEAAGEIGSKVLPDLAAWGLGTVTGGVAATGASALLNHQVPNANDFVTGTIVAIGMGAAGHYIGQRFVPSTEGKQVVQNLQDIYQRTGLTPEEVNRLSLTDDNVRQEIVRSRTPGGDQLTPSLDAYAARLGRSVGNSFGPEPASPYEPLKPEPPQQAATEEPKPGQMKPEQVSDVTLDVVRQLEGSGDTAVSPAGAIGRYQLMPATARAYGFDPTRLTDPAYNERAARAVLADLDNRFGGNLADMLVAYNAGPGRARAWIRGGRDFYSLPLETQKYLLHAERIGAIDSGFTTQSVNNDFAGDSAVEGSDIPSGRPEPQEPQEPGTEPEPMTQEGMTGEQAADKIMSKVGEIEAPESWAHKLNLGKLWRGFQFALTPAHAYDVAQGIGKNGSPVKKTTGIEDVIRSTLGSSGVANQFYERGPVVLSFDENGAPTYTPTKGANVIDAYRMVAQKGGTMRDFHAYQLALRTSELAKRGINTGIDPDAAKAMINAPGNFEKYNAAHQMLQDFHDGVLRMQVAAGTLSAGQAARIKANNEDYVTLNRVLDRNYTPPNPGTLLGVRQPFKTIGGSTRQIIPPEISTMDNLNFQTRMAMRNVALAHVIDTMREVDPDSVQLVQLVKISKATAVAEVLEARQELEKNAADEMGIGVEDLPGNVKEAIEPLITARELLAALKHERGMSDPERDVVLFRDGQPEVWRVRDIDMARMLKEVTGSPDDPLPGILNTVSRIERSGIVSLPGFVARAIFHASMAPAAFGEGGSAVPFRDLTQGIMSAVAGDRLGGLYKDAWDRYSANGGLGGTYNEVGRNMITPRLQDVMNGNDRSGVDRVPGAVVNVFKHPIEALRAIQHSAHTARSVGAMISSERKGIPTLRAAMLARKSSLDYAEKFVGGAVNTWASWVPFMPTGFKDFQQVFQSFEDRPVSTMARAALVLTAPTALLLLANKLADQQLDEKDRYDNLPQWLRDNYWITPPINGVRYRVPKPYVGGAMFATLPERVLNSMWDEVMAGDKQQAKDDLIDIAQGLLGRMAPPFIPTAIEPVVEQVTNHNFYTGRPLIPEALAKQSGYLQYSTSTSKTSVGLAKFLHDQLRGVGLAGIHLDQTSPIVLDNYVNEWAGSAPSEFWHQMGDTFFSNQPELLKRVGLGTEEPEGKGEAPKELAENPFTMGFVVRNPGAGQMLDNFYSAAAEVDQVHADYNRAVKEHDIEEAMKLRANPLLQLSTSSMYKALANMRKMADTVNHSTDLSDDDKLKYTDAISTQMYQLAKSKYLQIQNLKSLASSPAAE